MVFMVLVLENLGFKIEKSYFWFFFVWINDGNDCGVVL